MEHGTQSNPLAQTVGRLGSGQLLAAAVAVAAAFGFAWLAAAVNLHRSCVVRDTPYFDTCPSENSDAAQLRSRIASNPGDANAYVRLALLSAEPPQALLDAASRLAPADPNILMARAVAALRKNDIASSVEPLVQLVEYRDVTAAAEILARMITAGEGARLAPFVTPGTQWLNRVMGQMPQNPASISAALPLVVQALKAGVLKEDAARRYVRQLKAAGIWSDAFALWLTLNGGPLPTLYNAGFDRSFTPDGFDWEVIESGPPSRAGAIVERKSAEGRGAVLEVRFTGRTLSTPLVRQYLFIAPGRYRLTGDFLSRQLRMEKGLAWTVRCVGKPVEAGRSAALSDSQGLWMPFTFEFTIPPDCGLVASLQLETFTPVEASLGVRGRAAFDAFSLEKVRF